MWIKTKAPRARLPLAIALLLAWWLACWLATGAWFDDETQEAYRAESLKAERFVTTSTHDFERIVSLRTGLPKSLTRIPMVGQTLSRFGAEQPSSPTDEEERRRRWSVDPELAQTNRFLDASARDLGLDTLVLLNANGDCLAASNAGSERSSVGASYGDRNDFQSARAGRSGYQVIVDKKMPSVGLTLYAPVIDHGHFIGAVIVGIPLAPFANLFEQTDAFLSDRNGVVVLARDPSLLLHALPGAPVGRLDVPARQALYQRTELPTLALTPWGNARYPELLRVEGRIAPVILSSRSVADGGLTVSVLWPMPQLATLAQQRLLYAGALGTIGTLLMLLATAYVTRRREQRTMALALAQREQQATQARNFLDQVVKAIADPIFVKDREHRWVLVNQAFCKIHGQPRENFIGKSANDAFPERIAQGIWDADERVLTAGIEIIAEEKLTDSQGVTHIVVTKKVPYTDTAGQCFIVGTISDISERKQVERLLRAKEREFRNLAENNPDVIIRYDRECRRIYANSALATMAGREAKELVGRLSVDHTPLTDPERYMAELRRVMESGAPSSLEVPVRRANGEAGWYASSMVAEFDEGGEVVGVLTVARDITESKKAKALLEQREGEYRSLAANLPDNVSRWDVDGCYLYINPVHERTLGVSANDMIGKALPDSHTFVKAAIAQVVATGRATMLVRQPVVVDGETQIHDVSLAPEHDAEGHLVSVLGIGRDMTDIYRMREAIAAREQEFRSLAENLPVAVIRYDSECRRRYLNQSAQRMLHGNTSELLGLVPGGGGVPASPAMLQHYRGKMDEVLATGAARALDFVLDMLPADQQEHYEVRFVPEHGADGKIIGVLAIWNDITERKRAEVELQRSERELHRQAQFQQSLLSGLIDAGVVLCVVENGKFVYTNDHYLGCQLGYAKGQMPATVEFIELIHPDDRPRIAEMYRNRLAGKPLPSSYEIGALGGDGSRLEYEFHVTVIPDSDPAQTLVFALDIADRKRMQDAVFAREQEFRTLVETAPEPIFRYAPDGRRIYVNAAVERISGIPASVLLGRPSSDGAIAPAQDAAASVALVRRICETGEPGDIEVEIVGADGRLRHFHNRMAPEFGADGKVRSVFSICHDITERKAVEDALRESRESLNEAQRIAHVGSWDVDMVNDKLIWSDEIFRIWEIDKAYFKADFAAFIETVHPEDREHVSQAYGEALINHCLYQVEHRLLFPDGRVKYILERGEPQYDAQGNPVRFIGTSQDITSRRRMEDELQRGRLVLEDAQRIGQIGSWELDLVRGVLDWSDETCRMFEIDPAVFGASMDAFINVIHPEDRERVNAAYDASIKNRTAYDVEHRLLLPNGRIKDVRERGETWYDADGRPLRTLGTVQNITEAKLAEKRLRESRDIVRALAAHQETKHEKERKELAYQIHEDLAQNLAALRLNISLFEMSGESAPSAPLLKAMHDIADRSITRIRDIVSMLHPTVLDLGLVPALHWLTDDFKGFGFHFDLALPEDILISDEASTLLFRAAQEALLNIALHAAATHIHLSLATVAGVCRLVVRDNGCGFDPAAPRREGRFGLIRLTEQARYLGGDLSIDSSPDRGTALHIRVPGSVAAIST